MNTEPSADAGPSKGVRIVSWNCNMALQRKAPRLLALHPDVAVVQECASKAELDGMVRVAWTGRLASKGLAVFARPDLGATLAQDIWDPTREWFLPVRVPVLGLDLLACWAMNHRGLEDRPKKGRTGAALDHYRDFLSSGRAIILGDLNDNVTWDTKLWPVFANLTTQLAAMDLVSVYHARTGESLGAESRGSLFFYRDAQRRYLIDHVFVPNAWLGRVDGFQVGTAAQWLDVSDHAPVILDLSGHSHSTSPTPGRSRS